MTWDRFWLTADWAMLVLVLLMLVLAIRRPAARGFIPGLALVALAAVATLLRALSIIPPHLWLAARVVYVSIAILGGVLVSRAWARMRAASIKK
jgi:hypothetical protein